MQSKKIASAVAVAALAIPAGALAHPGHGHGNGGNHGNGHNPTVTYRFGGAYAGDGVTVDVTSGNHHTRKAGLVGTAVQFDFTNARITAADTNGDGTVDMSDLAAGDKVVVKARLPKQDPGSQPFAAKHLVDQTHPAD